MERVHIEYRKWYSNRIGHEMELKVYGHWGWPILVFPCAGGTFYEFEDFGMTELLRPYIDGGAVKLFTVGSLDNQTWLSQDWDIAKRARRHEDYDNYIVEEVVPFIHDHMHGKTGITAIGCSMGAYHSVNFLLRHPDIFCGTIALSGIYRLRHLIGDYMDDVVYRNSPLDYLPNLNEYGHLERLKKSRIMVCVGQGAWENEALPDTRDLKAALDAKGIPAWVDFWGHDVHHDWPWWKKQLPYFLEHLLNG